MSFNLSTPITGTAQTGLTAPTYTHALDNPPSNNGKQVYVTALGGTQTGVLVHSVGCPFTISAFKPQNPQVLGPVNPVTGSLSKVPMNNYSFITRKGVLPMAGQPYRTMIIKTMVEVPAGADVADPVSIRAALSAHFGAVSQQSAGIGDSAIQGTI